MTEREIAVKPLPFVRLAERSAVATTQPEVGPLVGPLFGQVADALLAAGQPVGQAVAYYATTEGGIECHAGFEFAGTQADGFEIGELPAEGEAVAMLHRGSMATIADSWGAVFEWIAASGFGPAGPCREVYLESETDDQEFWVTELQQPFVRRS